MKKTLIALAALAVVSAASAQSTVTMYGVADLSLVKATGTPTQMSGNGFNNGSSRLGVRGTEDLGGGLKASFNFEQGINAETGATSVAAFDRAANMSLSGNFGTVLLGRTLTPSFFGFVAWELTGSANYSVVANQFGFAGAGPRNNSQISYTTPKMGGFSATLGYVTDADMGAPVNNSKVDMNAIYGAGPLTVGFSYNKVANAARNVALGAKYNFGAFQVAGSLQDPAGAKKGFTIGAGANLGPVSLVLDIARDTGSAVKSTDWLAEVKYPLSKRTTAYGAYLRDGSSVVGVSAVNTYGVGLRHNF
nr:porin [Rhodoferax sp.]